MNKREQEKYKARLKAGRERVLAGAWPSAEEITAKRAPAGGWSRDTLADWGIAWPPRPGWKESLVGKDRAFFFGARPKSQRRRP